MIWIVVPFALVGLLSLILMAMALRKLSGSLEELEWDPSEWEIPDFE